MRFNIICKSKLEHKVFILFFFLPDRPTHHHKRRGDGKRNILLAWPKLIHAFNKSGRHLEFSMNDVIREKIIHVAKMATKDESSVDVDFAVCSYKKECFYFISRGIFSLYNVFHF